MLLFEGSQSMVVLVPVTLGIGIMVIIHAQRPECLHAVFVREVHLDL